MSLGERIEERLLALGLSQAELARRADVPQTTMNSLIRGKARTTPHLIRIARELETTPAFLMGETNDPRAEFPAPVFTQEELDWVYTLRRMQPLHRSITLQVAKLRIVPNDLDRLINEEYWEEEREKHEAEKILEAMPPESQKKVRARVAQSIDRASKPKHKRSGG
jgi:transcriptional regulator with XRE-family HTH domain